MNKMTDYAIILLAALAQREREAPATATELAESTHLPAPTVVKILKLLAKEGILLTWRGARGGYSLSRAPEEISVRTVIRAIEGPVGLTECSTEGPSTCDLEASCPTRQVWHRVNQVVQGALEGLTLRELVQELPPAPLEV